jgi:hypothetical protein
MFCTFILDFLFNLLSIRVIYTSTLIFFFLLFCYRSWLFTPTSWFSFCCYFVIDHHYLHQHLDFLFVVILLLIMIIYTSTLIFFLLLFCYRSWRFTPAYWFCFFILLSIMVIYTSTLIFFLLIFYYRSWLFTPAPWFSFCCYFVIDHGDLHQHLDFIFYFVIGHGYLYL